MPKKRMDYHGRGSSISEAPSFPRSRENHLSFYLALPHLHHALNLVGAVTEGKGRVTVCAHQQPAVE
jgi:hypothetical protein